MKFAFAGIDFLGGVFEQLIASGWTPVKLFTRPCDGIYDHNDVVVARARAARIPIQLSRIQPRDIDALHAEHGRDWALVVAGYPWLVRAGGQGELRPQFPSVAAADRARPLSALQGDPRRLRELGHDGPCPRRGGLRYGRHPRPGDFPRRRRETHETLLAKCQMSARRLAAVPLAKDLPARWKRSEPQGDGSYWARATDADRTLDFRQDVEAVLRRVRAFGTVETIARLGDTRAFIAEAQGWTEAHSHLPGTVVQRHRRHLVVAARDGYVQILRWSPTSLVEAAQVGR